MSSVQVRVPSEVWDNCAKKAKVMGKSGSALVGEILADTLEQMDAPEPTVPAVVEMYKIAAKRKQPKSEK